MSNRGQALIEALVSGGIVLFCLLMALKLTLRNIYDLSVYEIFEQYILCQTYPEDELALNACESNLKKRLKLLNIKKIHLKNKKNIIDLHVDSQFLQKKFSTIKPELKF